MTHKIDLSKSISLEQSGEFFEMTYAHTIDSLTKISTGQNSNDEVIAISIVDVAETQTLIKLQAS